MKSQGLLVCTSATDVAILSQQHRTATSAGVVMNMPQSTLLSSTDLNAMLLALEHKVKFVEEETVLLFIAKLPNDLDNFSDPVRPTQ